jgi:LuxR family transcriptional regulator, quorum-sensing system regulator BjaR1
MNRTPAIAYEMDLASDGSGPGIASVPCRNFVVDTISDLAPLTSLSQVVRTFGAAVAKYGFTAFGIDGLPAPSETADLQVLTESVPEGFRNLYVHERFYLVDHIGAHARTAAGPFRFSEAPFNTSDIRGGRRLLDVLQSFGIDKGFTVPVGRLAHLPACVWMAGADPDLHDEVERAMQLVALFTAAKSYAIAGSSDAKRLTLTEREREVLAWTARGKSAWEIGEILHIAKRTVDAHAQTATAKLGAANKTQAVVFALLRNIIDI